LVVLLQLVNCCSSCIQIFISFCSH